MRNTIKLTAVAVVLLGLSRPALADTAETKGGLTVKTDDGRFEMKIGGRIHYDAYMFMEDDQASTPAFGSETGHSQRGGFAFRRTYLTLTGKLYGWKYKFEPDFAAMGGTSTTTCTPVDVDADNDGGVDTNPTPACTTTTSNTGASGFREMWVATDLGPGEVVIGQFKPFRGMEELTSSNEITMIERPWTTATGIYNGRQFLMGLGYRGLAADTVGFGVHAMSLGAANTTNEGTAVGARLYYVPFAEPGSALHIGLSGSMDSEDAGSASTGISVPYAGRRGPSQGLGRAGVRDTAVANAETQTTVALELGWALGPFALQSEYAQATLDATHDADGVAGVPADSDVTAYYLQASLFVTGEPQVYSKSRGAFAKPKPGGSLGAWEITARYDFAGNGDQDALNDPCGDGVGTGGTFSECEATSISVGTNWYVNPNVRFMLNYYLGEASRGAAGTDEPEAVTLRTQLSF